MKITTKRTLKELFILLSKQGKEFKSQRLSGLCVLITNIYEYPYLLINKEELRKLRAYIKTHRPKKRSVHYNEAWENSCYYWPEGQWAPRLRWIKDQIKLLS